jgi:cyclopropane-fatty-acyl-phospholipid synthase
MNPYFKALDHVCRSIRIGSLAVTYWDERTVAYGHGEPKSQVRIRRPGIVPGLFLTPEMTFGDAYVRGDIEITGDIEAFLNLIALNPHLYPALGGLLNGVRTLLSRIAAPNLVRHREDVRSHYDLGNSFYQLWLDPTMTYSCAYFLSERDDLETAQRRKIRHILDKLRLKPGERLLDIGCGWGALTFEAAKTYGVEALGITLSDEQAAWFARLWEAGGCPDDSCVLLAHYRSIAESGNQFDKLVSVGMAEHVGRKNLSGFFRDLSHLLSPGGLGLLHCITQVGEGETNPWIVRRIFPGGHIPSVSEVIRGLSREGLILWDAENLGPHYALTLDRWAEGFEKRVATVERRFGIEFVRMWRLYLRSCAAAFRRGDLFVHQILFSKGKPHDLPLTRDDLYGKRATERAAEILSRAGRALREEEATSLHVRMDEG